MNKGLKHIQFIINEIIFLYEYFVNQMHLPIMHEF